MADLTIAACLLGSLLGGYCLLLLERNRKLLLGYGPFLVEHPLNTWEKLLLLVVLPLEVVALVLTTALLLGAAVRPFVRYSIGRGRLIAIASVLIWFIVFSAHFRVLQYFRDGISLAVIRGLSGGVTSSGLTYVQNELGGLLYFVIAWVVLVIAVTPILVRHGRRMSERLAQLGLVRFLASRRGLISVNVGCMLAPLLIVAISPPLNYALRFSPAHILYSLPAAELTDLDRDGYGLMTHPTDFAPLDPSRHPYAREIPGNGIDENGIGGDLPAIIWKSRIHAWNPDQLERRNVLLLVMDSMRRDILDIRVNGEQAMPKLGSLSGSQFPVISHVGYTIPSMVAMFNGTVSEGEKGISLIDRFKQMGYATGVFSSQNEGFGGIAQQSRMDAADRFVDGTAFPRDLRMFTNSSPGSLSIPAPLVNARFFEWLQTTGDQPFFAYVNWQELHFPYWYSGAPLPLIDRAVPRGSIVESNSDWVRRTYANAARTLDDQFAEVLAALDALGVRENTIILIVGDHGEELFENGFVGHGTDLSYEQNATFGKLIGARWIPPDTPTGLNDLHAVIHNALVRDQANVLPLSAEVLCFSGAVQRPVQVGLFTTAGLSKYDFMKSRWTKQKQPGEGFSPSEPDPHIIHLWESYVISELPQPRR